MFSSALCIAINYIFQKQCFADICVHWGQYKTHLFLHRIYFQDILWTIHHIERTETATAPGPALSTIQNWQFTGPDITIT